MAKPNPIPPNLTEQDVQRFWSKVNKAPGQGPNGDCWEWQGRIKENGYAEFGICRQGKVRQLMVHRLSYFLTVGIWPGTAYGLHSCDNRRCCNPKHIFQGTHQDNMDDMVKKNRQATGSRNARYTRPETTARGERASKAKLTAAQVYEIRNKYIQNVYSQSRLAMEYGVTKTAIRYILQGRNWRHL